MCVLIHVKNQIKNKFGLVKNPSSWEINNIIRF